MVQAMAAPSPDQPDTLHLNSDVIYQFISITNIPFIIHLHFGVPVEIAPMQNMQSREKLGHQITADDWAKLKISFVISSI